MSRRKAVAWQQRVLAERVTLVDEVMHTSRTLYPEPLADTRVDPLPEESPSGPCRHEPELMIWPAQTFMDHATSCPSRRLAGPRPVLRHPIGGQIIMICKHCKVLYAGPDVPVFEVDG